MQLTDVLNNGYWHARSLEYLHKGIMHTIEWLRLPGDVVFIGFGVVPLVIAAGKTYQYLRNKSKAFIS
jgi:nitric oxide reductase subunit B